MGRRYTQINADQSAGHLRLSAFICVPLIWLLAAQVQAAEWKLSVQPAPVPQGGIVFVRLEGGRTLDQPACEWLGHKYSLYPAGGGYRAALPVDRLHKVGLAALVVRAAGYQEPLATRNLSVVALNTGPIEVVRLTPERMALNQDPRVEEESKRLRQIVRTESPQQLWKGDFSPPTDQPGHNFGKQRRYLEAARKGRKAAPGWMSYHRGTDFSLPPGTPVPAANAGRVLAAEPFVLPGNAVFLDHGQGLITAYMHLSEIKVKPGDTVSPGQIVGLTGNTGRATGPHLHWALYVQGVSVNPTTVLHLPDLFR
jgi:hypothetical protein